MDFQRIRIMPSGVSKALPKKEELPRLCPWMQNYPWMSPAEKEIQQTIFDIFGSGTQQEKQRAFEYIMRIRTAYSVDSSMRHTAAKYELIIEQLNAQGAFRNLHLDGACLKLAKLTGLDLRGSSFCGADLFQVDLEDADVRGCNFVNALLPSVKIRGMQAEHAQFDGAIITLSFPELSIPQDKVTQHFVDLIYVVMVMNMPAQQKLGIMLPIQWAFDDYQFGDVAYGELAAIRGIYVELVHICNEPPLSLNEYSNCEDFILLLANIKAKDKRFEKLIPLLMQQFIAALEHCDFLTEACSQLAVIRMNPHPLLANALVCEFFNQLLQRAGVMED
jgi:hypothetical protein